MFHWCFISLAVGALIWQTLRSFIRKFTANDEIILAVDEFSGNIFSGVFIMELGVIAESYGLHSVQHIIGGFIMLLMRNLYLTYESVCSFADNYYENGRKFTISFVHCIVHVLCQISGMVIGQYIARFFWAIEAFGSAPHTEALNIACRTAISEDHSFFIVALVEFLGPLTMCLAAYFVQTKMVPVTVTTVAFINFYFFAHVSGSIYNQAIATAFTFQCAGQKSDFEFFVIYWLAPTFGQIVAWEILLREKLSSEEEIAKKVE